MLSPEIKEDALLKSNIIVLLLLRDLCILMIRVRGRAQERIEGNYFSGYEYNSLSLERGFLFDIKVILHKHIFSRLETRSDSYFLNDEKFKTKVEDLRLEDYLSGSLFDEDETINKRFELVAVAKQIFPSFERYISEDWKFL